MRKEKQKAQKSMQGCCKDTCMGVRVSPDSASIDSENQAEFDDA